MGHVYVTFTGISSWTREGSCFLLWQLDRDLWTFPRQEVRRWGGRPWKVGRQVQGQYQLDTLRLSQIGRHLRTSFANAFFLNETCHIVMKISLKFVPKDAQEVVCRQLVPDHYLNQDGSMKTCEYGSYFVKCKQVMSENYWWPCLMLMM